MARKFFYVSAALFLLALTYHLGARNAAAQFGSPISGYSTNANGYEHFVITADGNVFFRAKNGSGPAPFSGPAVLIGNFWEMPPTATTPSTMGRVKAQYRR